jgi:hypothetical protein
MRGVILLLTIPTLLLQGCDWGLGTDPRDFGLGDLSTPPRDHATVAVTQDLVGMLDGPPMFGNHQYVFPLITPPALPELWFEAPIAGGHPAITLVLEDVTRTGVFNTSDEAVSLTFRGPGGSVFNPVSDCRINVTSALNASGEGRLQEYFDCPVTDGTRNIRVLAKMDHSP